MLTGSATEKGRHDLFLGSWGVVTGDADYGLYAMYIHLQKVELVIEISMKILK